jgi:hypothetical protein
MATELVERTPSSEFTVADKGYDGDYLRWVIRERQSKPEQTDKCLKISSQG